MNELKEILPFEKFKIAFAKFLEQADKNIISGKAIGTRKPFGITPISNKSKMGKYIVSGGALGQQYGQGAASKTPYFNWHVVSIYYVVDEQKIKIGIEKNRYLHLEKLSDFTYESLGNKKTKVAVFYSENKSDFDYRKLYDTFITLSKEIMRIGV